MKSATAVLPLLLVACTVSQPPALPAPPIAPSPASAAQETSMAKRAPGQEPSAPLQIFRAFGTEPFWNVNVEGDTLTYATPEDQAGQVMQGERRALAGGVEIAGTHEGRAFALTVAAGACSDGMSDNRYELVSTFRYGDMDYKGCAEAAK